MSFVSKKWLLDQIEVDEKQVKDWEGTFEPENALVYQGRIEAYKAVLKQNENLGKIYEDMYWRDSGR